MTKVSSRIVHFYLLKLSLHHRKLSETYWYLRGVFATMTTRTLSQQNKNKEINLISVRLGLFVRLASELVYNLCFLIFSLCIQLNALWPKMQSSILCSFQNLWLEVCSIRDPCLWAKFACLANPQVQVKDERNSHQSHSTYIHSFQTLLWRQHLYTKQRLHWSIWLMEKTAIKYCDDKLGWD